MIQNKESGLAKLLGLYITKILSIVVETVIIAFFWNKLAIVYFSFLPLIWLNIPFLHILGFIVLINLLVAIFRGK